MEASSMDGATSGVGAASPSPPASGSGERCKLPQRGLGWSPERKCILDALRAEKTRVVATIIV